MKIVKHLIWRKTVKKILVVLVLALSCSAAGATPGAVNKSGCHGKKGPQGYHCHPASELSEFKNGRRYVRFGDDTTKVAVR